MRAPQNGILKISSNNTNNLQERDLSKKNSKKISATSTITLDQKEYFDNKLQNSIRRSKIEFSTFKLSNIDLKDLLQKLL